MTTGVEGQRERGMLAIAPGADSAFAAGPGLLALVYRMFCLSVLQNQSLLDY
jgi:hypothetical protein